MLTLRIVLPQTVFSTQGEKKIRKKAAGGSDARIPRRACESGPRIIPRTFPAGYSLGERKAAGLGAWSSGDRPAEHADARPVSPAAVSGVDRKPRTGQRDRTDSIQDAPAWPEGPCTRLTTPAVHTACSLSGDVLHRRLLGLSPGCLSHTRFRFRESGVYWLPQRIPCQPSEVSHVSVGAGDNGISCP